MHIAYFITGHGYGHAVRSATIARYFSPSTTVTFITDVPETFFRQESRYPFRHLKYRLDCGCLQADFVTVDRKKTLEEYAAISVENKSATDEIVDWCSENHVNGIVSDIVPAAFDIAARCSVPSLAVTNFTWYDIYHEFIADFPSFEPMVDTIRDQYRSAGKLLALAPALPMTYFSRIEPIPVVGRNGRNCKRRLLEKFNLEPDKKVAIIYIGDFGSSGTMWNRLATFSQWEFFGLHPVSDAPENYHLVNESGFSYPDFIASADCVVGKLGYGLVAESMINGTPIIFLPREHFAEYPLLERAVTEWGGGIRLSPDDFTSLGWKTALKKATSVSPSHYPVTEGAATCARSIESYISLNSGKKR